MDCLECGHPSIDHTAKGCTVMLEADTEFGWDWCPCEQAEQEADHHA